MTDSDIAWQDLALGIGEDNLILDGVIELERMVLTMFTLAQRSVLVRAHRFEWPIFHTEELDEQIKRIITSEMTNRILFLIEDEQFFMQNNTRLLAQCRQHSSYVKIRTLAAEYREPVEFFMVVDNIAFLHQARTDVSYGVANLNAAGRARTLSRQFNEAWERSEPPAELFRLGL